MFLYCRQQSKNEMRFLIFLILTVMITTMTAQEVVELPYQDAENVTWKGGENAYYSKDWETDVITNVSKPVLEVYRPAKVNGVSVVIAPGGALYAHSIESEGRLVAKWLAEKGITAFVLKYRLIPTDGDGVKQLAKDGEKEGSVAEKVSKVLPYSIKDALAAIEYVRKAAGTYGLDTARIGLIGFSAGGAVAMGVAYDHQTENRPDFLVPVYAWTDVFEVQSAPKKAPPMFVVCATDDPLGLAGGSVEIYNSWLESGTSVAMQMYSQGGHGFGMRKQGLPSDNWIERFYEWMLAEKLLD